MEQDMHKRAELTSAQTAKDYTLGGAATLTLRSLKSNTEVTYQVRAWGHDTHVVLFLQDDDPEYLGIIDSQGFTLTMASGFTSASLAAKAFGFFWRAVESGRLPPRLRVYREGTCEVCGRALLLPKVASLLRFSP